MAVPGGGMALAPCGTGKLALDTGRLEADAGHGPVPLTRLEFLLLKELASHAERPVPRAALLAAVWGLGFGLIKTVRGKGYQLTAGLR